VDELTELANRAQFFERFGQAAHRRHGALLLVDIDRFSAINKALGHAVGDALLRGWPSACARRWVCRTCWPACGAMNLPFC
jgi:diguanylate cyclase (GGDEF)-like protein